MGSRLITPLRDLRREMRSEPVDPDLRVAMMEARLARPTNRSQCRGGERPCPFVGCRYALALDVTCGGGLQENVADLDLETTPDTCSLDVADRGPHTLEEVGKLYGVSRERIRQIERHALRKLRRMVSQGKVVLG